MTPTREKTSRDEILGLPDDALDFREWWQELTGRKPGRPLIARLGYAVATGTLGALTESTETGWKEVANNQGGRREANILECAVLCARVAAIDPADGFALDALCDRFSSFGPFRQRHGIDRRRWPALVEELIHQSPEGSLLRPEDSSFSPAIAWDLVNRFWADRQDRAPWARRPLPGFKTLVALWS